MGLLLQTTISGCHANEKMAMVTVNEEGFLVSGGVEEEDKRDDMVEFRYEPKAES